MATRSDKKHTEEFKAEAIKMVRESGRTIKSVAQEIGVGESTLHSWLNKKPRVEQIFRASKTAMNGAS